MPGVAAERRGVADVALKREGTQVFDESSVGQVPEAFGPQQLGTEQGVILLFDRRTASRDDEFGPERKPQFVFRNRQKGHFRQQLKVIEAGLPSAFLRRLLNPLTADCQADETTPRPSV